MSNHREQQRRKSTLFYFLSRYGFFFISILPFSAQAAIPSSVPLRDLFSLAKNQHPSFAVPEQTEAISQATYQLTRGALLPKVSAGYSLFWQEAPNSGSTALSNTQVRTGTLSLSQPLFRGGGEFSALGAAKRKWEATTLEKEWTLLTLFGRVASLAFGFQSARENFEIAQELRALSETRVKEIRQRAQIGRSRQADLLSAQAQWYQNSAAEMAAQAELSKALAKLEEVIGKGLITEKSAIDWQSILQFIGRAEGTATRATARSEAMTEILENRPDWQAKILRQEAADKNVWVAQSGHLPQVDVGANYYWYRYPANRGGDWDATLKVTLPIFSGMTVQSNTREAIANRKREELERESLKRQIETEIASAQSLVASLETQKMNLSEAKDMAEANFKAQTRDERLGIATSLEVITALNQLAEIKRSLSRVQLQWVEQKFLLAIAAGKIKSDELY